jgi:hypothetical protein
VEAQLPQLSDELEAPLSGLREGQDSISTPGSASGQKNRLYQCGLSDTKQIFKGSGRFHVHPFLNPLLSRTKQ